jgi:hypothetical protein
MRNPIPKSNLWHTPEDLSELQAMINQFTGEQAALAAHVMMLTLNACNSLVDKEIQNTYNTNTNNLEQI